MAMASQDVKFTLDYPNSLLSQKLSKADTKARAAILMYAGTKASKIQADMQYHRPWTDRTGMAKATLNAKVSLPSQNVVRITLAHGVSYGIWLELAHGKNWAIVGPTVNKEGPKMVSELNSLMSKINL